MNKSLKDFFGKPGAKTTKPITEISVNEESSEPMIIDQVEEISKPTMKEKSSSNTQTGVDTPSSKAPTRSSSNLGVAPIMNVTKKLEYKKFSPSNLESSTFDPKKEAPFDAGQMAPFFFICECFDLVSELKGQNSVERKKRVLINMFKSFEILHPSEVADFYLFATGRLEAEYLQEDLGVGSETMVKACAAAIAGDKKKIKDDIIVMGELGKVIEERKSKTQTMDSFFAKEKDTKRLTFAHVYNEIKKLPKHSGQKEKEGILQTLIYDCTGIEAKYIIRFLQNGNFKMGCAKATIHAGLARCYYEVFLHSKFTSTPEEWEAVLKRCSHQHPNYRLIIKGLQESKGDTTYVFKHCHLTPGIPCKPMLAKPTKDIRIIFTRFENKQFTCEYKYDGLRGQIHYLNKKLVIYSRNLENMTAQYPDVCKNILESINETTKDFIVDSEIVGMDHTTVPLYLL